MVNGAAMERRRQEKVGRSTGAAVDSCRRAAMCARPAAGTCVHGCWVFTEVTLVSGRDSATWWQLLSGLRCGPWHIHHVRDAFAARAIGRTIEACQPGEQQQKVVRWNSETITNEERSMS